MICRKTPKSITLLKFISHFKTLNCTFKVYILKGGKAMTNFKSGVGSNIKLIRKLKNITQEELAEIIGIHPRQLSKIETGDHFPSCKTLEKLCAALDISPKELFDFEFLIEDNEGALTGTDDTIALKVDLKKDRKNDNIVQLRPNLQKEKLPQNSSDESMAKTAKLINKPVFVEYFEKNKTSKIVVFYPDGREKVIKSSIDVEANQNMIYMMKEFKKISKDANAVDFVKCALSSLHSDDDLRKLASIVYGMKLARGIE